MTLDRARELLEVQADFGGSYNRNGARLILAEVVREHGQQAADALIMQLRLTERLGIEAGGPPGTRSPGRRTQSE